MLSVREIEGDFGVADFRREEVKAEDLIPDEVVFLAPGSRLVEGQLVVVAPAFISLDGHDLPLGGHVGGGVGVVGGDVELAEADGHLSARRLPGLRWL